MNRLSELSDSSVQCVVTSPPYWGLRDYETATWEDGDEGCDHRKENRNALTATMTGGTATLESRHFHRGACGKCGARRIDAQLGLEPTPETYVARLVEVFREVRRVLRDDGTLWLNLGDSYMRGGRGGGAENCKQRTNVGSLDAAPNQQVEGWKPKDLVGIPWRTAFALQADGWYLRSDIIWSKPNPMPESVTDRPTKSHEYLFLLTKSASYYFDQEAVKEPSAYPNWPNAPDRIASPFGQGFTRRATKRRTVRPCIDTNGGGQGSGELGWNVDWRNIRSVWTIATEPFHEAHFATFPRKLVEPCVKAGSRQGDIILDPFAGSGTTDVVALSLGRSFVGIELNLSYAEMARRRINGVAPLFAVVR